MAMLNAQETQVRVVRAVAEAMVMMPASAGNFYEHLLCP